VTLSGVGDLTRGTLFSHVVTKGSTFTEHLHGTERQATAAGSVDGEPIAGTVVFAHMQNASDLVTIMTH